MKTVAQKLGVLALVAGLFMAFAFSAPRKVVNVDYEYISEDATSYTVGESVGGGDEELGQEYFCNEHATKKCLVNSPVPPSSGIILKSSGATAGPAQRIFVDNWSQAAGDQD